MDSLSSMGVQIGAQVNFQTKMDDFQLNAVSFSGNISAKEPLMGGGEKPAAGAVQEAPGSVSEVPQNAAP